MPRKKSCLYWALYSPAYVPFLTVAVGAAFRHCFTELPSALAPSEDAAPADERSSQAAAIDGSSMLKE
jgi:hypothetical protein